MEGDPGRLVEDLPAGVPEAVAPVEVLHVEPVALVEQADLAHRLGAAEHEGAVDGVDLARLVVAEVGRPVLAQRPAAPSPRPTPVKWARALSGVGKERLQAWSSSPDSVTSLHPDHADPRLGAQPRQRRVEGPRVDLGVGVEQQHRLRLALAQDEVVGGREADVARGAAAAPRGNSRATMSGVPSGLPLSTTVTRIAPRRRVLAAASAGSAAAALRRRG